VRADRYRSTTTALSDAVSLLPPPPAVPQIKTTDQTYITDARKPISMAVPYSAYPQAEADWLYDGQTLPRDNVHTSADRSEYLLKDPVKTDEGRYKIILKNRHGQGEAFINLEVIGELRCSLPVSHRKPSLALLPQCDRILFQMSPEP